MFGAIAGDIIGSVYEGFPIKTKVFPLFQKTSRFTDDSVLTVATAHAILTGEPYREAFQRIGRRYPDAGYGGSFIGWLFSENPEPYNSWGNGAAMRTSPVGFAFETEDEIMSQAKAQARVSHNHPEGIKGAQAAALAVFLARKGRSKKEIASRLQTLFGYDFNRTVDEIRPGYRFDVSCQGSVPEALISFFEADTWEDAVRNAVSLGGDSDTLACIAGAAAEAYFRDIPSAVLSEVKKRLPGALWEKSTLFYRQYGIQEIRHRLDTI